MIADRNAGTVGFTTAVPTVEQLSAFYVGFAPQFAAAAKKIEALTRPSGIDSELKTLFAALDAAVADAEQSAKDPAAVQAEIDGGEQTKPVVLALQAATTAAGLPECNG
jgi:hypothetical protein